MAPISYIRESVGSRLCSCSGSTASQLLKPSASPHITPLEERVYKNLYIYAHLIDISYCIDSYHQIEEPFLCELCTPNFKGMSLICQWYFDDSVCGYIAQTTSNIFEYDDSEAAPRRTFVVSLRGTRSLYDTIADLKVDMTKYENAGSHLLPCGDACRVHSGFWQYYKRSIATIEETLVTHLDLLDSYELIFLGHSLGGSVAVLLALHFLGLGYSNVTLVTMGQPLVGNEQFTAWADHILGSEYPVKHNSFDRKYLRVIHKGDVVSTVPRRGNFFETYALFDNQIYINTTSDVLSPDNEDVVDCGTGDNPHCIAGDYVSPFAQKISPFTQTDVYRNHNTYFRRMGLCGIHIPG